jgi:hypothetical protein
MNYVGEIEEYDKKPSKKSLSLRKRHFGMSALDRIEVKQRKNIQKSLETAICMLADDSGSDIDDVIDDILIYHEVLNSEIKELEVVDPQINEQLPKMERKHRTIDSFEEDEIRALFRSICQTG